MVGTEEEQAKTYNIQHAMSFFNMKINRIVSGKNVEQLEGLQGKIWLPGQLGSKLTHGYGLTLKKR